MLILVLHFVLFFWSCCLGFSLKERIKPTQKKKKRFVLFRSSPSRPFTLFLFFFFTAELGSPGKVIPQAAATTKRKKHYIREPNSSGIEISLRITSLLRFFSSSPMLTRCFEVERNRFGDDDGFETPTLFLRFSPLLLLFIVAFYLRS